MLRRHVEPTELTRWWWSKFEPTADWILTAADLGIITASGNDQETNLAAAAAMADCDEEWSVEELARGGYAGNADAILTLGKDHLGDGAFEALHLAPPRHSASWSRQQPAPLDGIKNDSGAQSRTRFRASGVQVGRRSRHCLRTSRTRPQHDADASHWAKRLVTIGEIWATVG